MVVLIVDGSLEKLLDLPANQVDLLVFVLPKFRVSLARVAENLAKYALKEGGRLVLVNSVTAALDTLHTKLTEQPL